VFGGDRPAGLVTRVEQGGAARILIDVSQGANLLVVGSRGHGGFAGLLLGSVSSACAEHAACPVLVVHGETPPPTPGSVV
jgi:nucleotide-binding universal stress UspA family protein